MTTTNNLGLTTYSSESGSLTTFLNFRLAIAGTTTSNLITLDNWAGETSGSINLLKTHSIFTASGTAVSTNYYVATVAGIISYSINPTIDLKVNVSITGSTTLNINSLGDVVLKKIDSGGNIVNLASGDMIANQYYIFVFNGTNFVMVSGGSGTSASSTGAPSDSPFVTSGSTPNLTNYRILAAGSNVTITSASVNGGNIIINSSGTGGSTIALGNTIPQSINISGSTGTSGSASHEDHIHAHGNLSGSNLHALATSFNAGFMPSLSGDNTQYLSGSGGWSTPPIGGSDFIHNIDGALSAGSNIAAFVSARTSTIQKIYIYGTTLGTSGSTIIDIHKTSGSNIVTIFTNQ